MMKFIGRKRELDTLELLHKKKSSSFVVIRGRRRIGKSRLIEEFSQGKNALVFSGLPPVSGNTKQRQIDAFSSLMSKYLNIPKFPVSEWDDLFWYLADQIKEQNIIIVLDEISWMGFGDINFLGYLKNAWDLYFSKNPHLILIVCGSVSSWIEKNILSNTGFLGRISIDMVLEELSLDECNEFWKKRTTISAYEKLNLLSITGGVPKYLEEIIPEQPAEENIRRLCFDPQGLLFREYDQIFSDLFSSRAQLLSRIVRALSKGALTLDELATILHIEKSGVLSGYLKELSLSGFIIQDTTWSIKTKKFSSLKKFRLKDNYLRFYIHHIEPNKEKIEKHLFQSKSLHNLPGWDSILGLQFENTVLNNLEGIYRFLKIDPQDVVMAGPFFQRTTHRMKGCQIDLLIQTTHHVLFLCEIKFSSSEIKNSVIQEVKEKIEKFSYPKGYSISPVLIVVNGASRRLVDDDFFHTIIDFSDLLEKPK